MTAGARSLAARPPDQQRPSRADLLAARLARFNEDELDDMAFWAEDRWLAEFIHTNEEGQQYIDTGRRASGHAFAR